MLVICGLPEIYDKYKARWIEQQKINGFIGINNKEICKLKSLEYFKLWNRLNNDSLTPLTLAADLGRTKMLTWLLHERKKIQWTYGDVSCVLHPLDQLDLGFHELVNEFKYKVMYILILFRIQNDLLVYLK
jgi:hypothetical protein